MKFHPLASVFPLLEGDDFETLTESIVPTACAKPLCSILTVRFSMAGTASGPVSKPESNRASITGKLDGRGRAAAKQKGNTMSNHCDCDCEEHMRLFEEAALRGHLLRAAILIDDDGEGEEVWMITPFDKEGQPCGKPSILADIGDWIERMPVVYDDTADLPAPVQHISVHGYPLKN